MGSYRGNRSAFSVTLSGCGEGPWERCRAVLPAALGCAVRGAVRAGGGAAPPGAAGPAAALSGAAHTGGGGGGGGGAMKVKKSGGAGGAAARTEEELGRKALIGPDDVLGLQRVTSGTGPGGAPRFCRVRDGAELWVRGETQL